MTRPPLLLRLPLLLLPLLLLLLASPARADVTVHVLVTGFLPFLNYTDNPSGDVARALDGRCDDMPPLGPFAPFTVCWEGLVLPVNATGSRAVADVLTAEYNATDWDAVVHVGLEDRARGLKIETVAANVRAEAASGTPIDPDAPPVLPVTADLGRMTLAEVFRGLTAAAAASAPPADVWSRDAGTYYCNETLFRTLWAIRRGAGVWTRRGAARLLPAAFVHLPDPATVPVAEDVALVARIGAALVAPVTA